VNAPKKEAKAMAWIYLFLAGLFEVAWAIGLKYTEGFSRLTTAARSLVTFVNKVGRLGTSVVFAAGRPSVRRTLNRARLKPPLVRYSATAREAATMTPQ
jgi:hypothetical protein